ncbi:MAG: GGDEF domain-containing protein [Synergistetes bacterium]|nr:GGDEF domain-containing protein [Synergistota bacterium]MDW8192333.1 GGDEF domain-containing protein [Synergistota bacterium]
MGNGKRGFEEEYQRYLEKYVLEGGDERVLYEAYETLIELLDISNLEATNIVDIHISSLKRLLNLNSDTDCVSWLYIKRATEFLTQILVISDTLVAYLKESAEIDKLTGFYNRIGMEKVLTRAWVTSNKTREPFVLAMLDIDNFKSVNDSYGHPLGDRLLREVSDIIRGSVRSGDAVIRYGGEEFLILLVKTNKERAMVPLERIRKRISESEFTNKKISITVSIGVSSFPDDNPSSLDELIRFADIAMYEAKRRGKNMVLFYSDLGG